LGARSLATLIEALEGGRINTKIRIACLGGAHAEGPLLAQSGRSYASEISWSIANEQKTIQFQGDRKTLSTCSGAGRALAMLDME
jgi:hypothetical protein